jgi:hypothetical protein
LNFNHKITEKCARPKAYAAPPGPGASKTVRKNAAFEVFAKGLAHIGLGSAVVALPIVLTRAGQLQPSLEMFGYCFVKQRALGVARDVEFGPAYPGGLCGDLPHGG